MTETLSLFEPDGKQKWMCTGVFDQAGKINGGFHFRLLTRYQAPAIRVWSP